MRKSESTWRAKGGSDLVVGGDWAEVPCVEVVDLPNEMIDVVRRKRVVLLQIIEGNEGESGWKVPPMDMNGRTGVLGREINMHHRGVEGEGG